MGNGVGVKLCQYGHKDFTEENENTYRYGTKTPVPYDNDGHGTNVIGLIGKYAGANVDYCIVVIKYYSSKQSGTQNQEAEVKSLEYANYIKADIINYSGGGYNKSLREEVTIKSFLNRGGKFIAAAGNDRLNIDYRENAYYPAVLDSRIVVVGNKNANGLPSGTSNYGSRVNVWEYGNNQVGYGINSSGTSQATAVTTGKILSKTKNNCDIQDYNDHKK